MGRPKKNFADPDRILKVLFKTTQKLKRDCEAELKKLRNDQSHASYWRSHELHGILRRWEWLRIDLDLFAGKQLTPSERKTWQAAILELEEKKLIEVYGIRASEIRLTRKGKKAVKELLAR